MNKITLKGKTELGKINKHIYGHFAEHLVKETTTTDA